MLIKIPFGFLVGLGPQLWKDVNKYERLAASGTLNAKTEVSPDLMLSVRSCVHQISTAQKCSVPHHEDLYTIRWAWHRRF